MSQWIYEPWMLGIVNNGQYTETTVGTRLMLASPPVPHPGVVPAVTWPTLRVENHLLRYAWAGLELRSVADPSFAQDVTGFPPVPPPSGFYTTFFNLLTPAPIVGLGLAAKYLWQLIGSGDTSYPPSVELLPLVDDEASPLWPYYRLRIIAAHYELNPGPANGIPGTPDYAHWQAAWAFTYFDLIFGTVALRAGGGDPDVLLNLARRAYPVIRAAINALLLRGSTLSFGKSVLLFLWAQVTADPDNCDLINDLAGKRIASPNGPLGPIMAILTLGLADYGIAHEGRTAYDVTLEIRRGPVLHADDLSVPSNGAGPLAVRLLIPDALHGQLDLAADDFWADTSLSADGKVLTLANVTLARPMGYVIPGVLTVVIPTNITIRIPSLQPGAAAVTMAFNGGLGAVLQAGAAQDTVVQVRFDLDPWTLPWASVRSPELDIAVHVVDVEVICAWTSAELAATTGIAADVPLTVQVPPNGQLDLRSPFSAVLTLAPDGSSLTIEAPLPGALNDAYLTDPHGTGLPITIVISVSDVSIADLWMPVSMRAALSAGPGYLPNGLAGMLRPRRAGEVTLTATMDFSSPNLVVSGAQVPAPAELRLQVSLGLVSLRLPQSTLDFDDRIRADLIVELTMPDGTSAGPRIQSDISVSSRECTLAAIVSNLDAGDPVDLPFVVRATASLQDHVVGFDGTDCIGGASGGPSTQLVSDGVRGVISAEGQGSALINVAVELASNPEVQFRLPRDRQISCTVQPPAALALDQYAEVLNGTPDTWKLLTGPVHLWRTSTVQLYGKVAHVSPLTTVTVTGMPAGASAQHTLDITSGDLTVTLNGLVAGAQTVTLSVEKATNFGHASTVSVTFVGELPTIVTTTVLQSPTGDAHPNIALSGTLSQAVHIVIVDASHVEHDIPLVGSIIATDGSFSAAARLPDGLSLGMNYVSAYVVNPFGRQSIAPQSVVGRKPAAAVTVNGQQPTTQPNGDARIDTLTSPVHVHGDLQYTVRTTTSQFTVMDPAGQRSYDKTFTGSSFDIAQLAVPDPGKWRATLTMTNDFGSVSGILEIRNMTPVFTFDVSIEMDAYAPDAGYLYQVELDVESPTDILLNGNQHPPVNGPRGAGTSYDVRWTRVGDLGARSPLLRYSTWMYNGNGYLVRTNDLPYIVRIHGELEVVRGGEQAGVFQICGLTTSAWIADPRLTGAVTAPLVSPLPPEASTDPVPFSSACLLPIPAGTPNNEGNFRIWFLR